MLTPVQAREAVSGRRGEGCNDIEPSTVRSRQRSSSNVGAAAIQLPWKPGGTRWGMRILATGAAAISRASRMTRSVVSAAKSITSPISQPSSSAASADAGTNTNSPG